MAIYIGDSENLPNPNLGAIAVSRHYETTHNTGWCSTSMGSSIPFLSIFMAGFSMNFWVVDDC
jgi:hypothetical protein